MHKQNCVHKVDKAKICVKIVCSGQHSLIRLAGDGAFIIIQKVSGL